MKKLIAGSWTYNSFDQDKFGKILLLCFNSPIAGSASPSQMVFNHQTHDLIPVHRRSFTQECQTDASLLEKRAHHARDLHIQHFNRTAHFPLPLSIGNNMDI